MIRPEDLQKLEALIKWHSEAATKPSVSGPQYHLNVIEGIKEAIAVLNREIK